MTSLGVRGRVWNDVIDFNKKCRIDRKFQGHIDDVIVKNFKASLDKIKSNEKSA